MVRLFIILTFGIVILTGCAADSPITPESNPDVKTYADTFKAMQEQNHYLWGEWTFLFNPDHDQVDIIPKRQVRLHLNATKFLEEYCTDCLKITKIKNNGDSTIDLTIKVEHPFTGYPEYTGFDVKGIIMFNGSHYLRWDSKTIFPYKDDFIISWRDTGDPELLNPDGYTPRWCPTWDSDSPLPIFNYWPGKYSSGIPTANVNGYINFYTDDERHMFRVNQSVEQIYHIYLPPGPVAAGYAIEASWEPPIVTPVTDPINDFPISANQVEPYYCNLLINNGEPITYDPCCGYGPDHCDDYKVITRQWYGHPIRHWGLSWPPPYMLPITGGSNAYECEDEPPPGEKWISIVYNNFTKFDDG
ncbi:MAG: hypothetical protein ABIG42_03205 [bacterium]